MFKSIDTLVFLSICAITMSSSDNDTDLTVDKRNDSLAEDTTEVYDLQLMTRHPARDDRFSYTTSTEGTPSLTTVSHLSYDWMSSTNEDYAQPTHHNRSDPHSERVAEDKAEKIGNKRLVFFSGYLFYVLYEMFWFWKGFFGADNATMYIHSSRLLTVHFAGASLIIYALRVPVAALYFALIFAHRFMYSFLLPEMPSTLFPDKMTKSQYYIAVSYLAACRVTGGMLRGLGQTENWLKDKIDKLNVRSNPTKSPIK